MFSRFRRRGYSQDGTLQDPQSAKALESFLRANTWNEARAILEAHRKLLLQEQVLNSLRARVAYRRAHPFEGDLSADELAMHLEVLNDARRYGIISAWELLMSRRRHDVHDVSVQTQPRAAEPFLDSQSTGQRPVIAGETTDQGFSEEEVPGGVRVIKIQMPSVFGGYKDEDYRRLIAGLWVVDTPDSAYSLISHNLELFLSLGFRMYLKQEASKCEKEGWAETASAFLHWHTLLEDADDRGLSLAWESHKHSLNFVLIRTQISLALEKLLTAESPEEARQVVKNQFALLISTTAEQYLREASAYYRRIRIGQLAEACQSCLRLQADLRQNGPNVVEDGWQTLFDPLRVFNPSIPVDIPNDMTVTLRDMHPMSAEREASALSAMIASLHDDRNGLLRAVLHLRRGQVHAENETLPEYQERSLADFNAALDVLTRDEWPICWVTALKLRAEILAHRFGGDQATNLAQAYVDDHAARELVFPDILPTTWAGIHGNMGRILMEPSRERYAEEIEQAFAEFGLALKVFRRDILPGDWAHITMMQGIAYHRRVHGERADNLERALDAYSDVLNVWTRETNPKRWSMVRHNRALIYEERLRGNHADNVERAIEDLTAALEVRTREADEIYWAESHANRGRVYSERVLGDRLVNLELALKDLDQALEVRTRTTMPHLWAQTVYYRAIVHLYLAFVSDDPAAELRRSLDDVASCLEIYTETSAPWLWWHALLIRARASEILGDYFQAHQTYAVMQRGYLALSGANWTDNGRIDVLGKLSETDLYVRDAAVLLLQDPPDLETAVLTLEEGRAQDLRAALSVDLTTLSSSKDPSVRMIVEELDRATAEWRDAQRAAEQPIDPHAHPKQVEDEIITRRQRLEASYARYRRARDAAGQLAIPEHENREINLQYLAEATSASGSALVYLFVASRGGHAIIVHQDGERRPVVQHLPLPDFTEDAVSSLLLTTATRELHASDRDRHTVLATGGLVAAQMKLWRGILPAWGTNLREAAAALPPRTGFRTVSQLLVDVWSNDPDLHHLTIRPFNALRPDEWQRILDAFESTLLNLELHRCIDDLGRRAFNSLADFLMSQKLSTVSLIPFGRLGLLPLASALIDQQGIKGYFCDWFDTRMAPSGLAVRACNLRAVQLESKDRPLILTLGNPKPHPPTIRDLPSAETESQAVHDIALARGFLPERVLRLAPEDGTKGNVIIALRRAWLAHLAVHGWYNVDDPMNSFLVLAGDSSIARTDRHLYLYEALQHKLDLKGLRLLVLSACETAMSDVLFVPDEGLSMASGFLQAGAAGVVASLWAVDDEATYLLIARFFQLYLDRQIGYTPAQALAAAQKWLREEATNSVLAAFDPSQLAHNVMPTASRKYEPMRVESSRSVSTNMVPVVTVSRSLQNTISSDTLFDIRASAAIRAEEHPDELPYSEPIFWAGFSLTGC